MPPPRWLDQVRRAVVRRGLPADYADRLVTELREHAEDAGNDPAALGPPEAVAAAAVRGYRSDRWAGRHPVLTQLVAPLFTALFGWVVFVNAGVWLVDRLGGTHDPISLAVAHVLVFASRFAVPQAAVGGLWWLHRRSGRPRWWFAAGGATVALFAATYAIHFTPPGEAADHEPEVLVLFTRPESWWSAAQAAAVALPVLMLARPDRPRSLAAG